MSNLSIQLSNHSFENKQIRTTIKNGEMWFIAKDICDAVNISNVTDALIKLDEDEKATIGLTDRRGGMGAQRISIVSESGMYTLILRCRDAVKKDTAPYKFRKWVTSEVLPAIRKTGSYAPTTNVTPNRELLPKGVYHNKSAHKPYRAYVYDMCFKKEISVGTFATVDEALDAQKDYFQTKPFKTAPIPAHGRWLAISDINGIEVKNIDGYNCVNFKQFRKLQSDARTYAEETIKLLHKIQDVASLSHEFLYRLKVLEGVENASRLDTPILDLLKN